MVSFPPKLTVRYGLRLTHPTVDIKTLALLNQGMKLDILKFQTLYPLCVSAPLRDRNHPAFMQRQTLTVNSKITVDFTPPKADGVLGVSRNAP
ncbi:MAG: hypothetical protein ACRAVC_09385 [Trichormus sp.]